MNIKAAFQDARRIVIGAVCLLALVLAVWHFNPAQNAARQLALKAQRGERVAAMQVALAAAVEAEKSAVLATTDAASQTYADQARAATAEVERQRAALAALLQRGSDPAAQDALAQFASAFAEFQRIDQELLALAVQNTNLKAYALTFGPAAAALHEMDGALARLAADDANCLRLADAARIAAWRLLALLPPHIAEESEPKMQALEAQMSAEDETVRQSLTALTALPLRAGNSDLKTAAASYARFGETRAQILQFSRANTNVRSLSLSLNQKRKVMLLCQSELAAVQQAIQAEPVAGITYGNVKPR